MEYIIYFVLAFIICYVITYFFFVRKKDDYDANKVSTEVRYLIYKYNIDVKNINFKKFLNAISLVESFDMALVFIIIFDIKNIFLQLLVGFIVLIPLILISFKLLGSYYKKKGLIKDERKSKRNRK